MLICANLLPSAPIWADLKSRTGSPARFSETMRLNSKGMSNDRLSYLSDSLLSHILSYLPTKNAVATSILSKRWRTLWRSNTTLYFCDEGHTENQTQYLRFVEFVYSILISRDNQLIKNFWLHCHSQFSCDSNINKWVNHAIQRLVEHVEIDNLQQVRKLFMPPSIFTCKTIVTLKLSGLKVNDFSCVCLPSLKNLHLESVGFANSACVAKLLSSVTLVEHLILDSVSPGLGNGCLEIFPKLISADVNFDMPWKGLCLAESLCLNLESLNFYIGVPTFPNLVKLELYLFSFNGKWLVEILKESPKLQNLIIHKEQKKGASLNIQIIGDYFAYSTARLPSNLRKCHLKEFEGEERELQFAKYIMENATALITMKVSSFGALSSDAKLQMTKQLLSYKRISPNCQLLFE